MSADRPEEQISIVMAGHVDHGKSTVIGRLLADTGALPRGKLEAVKDVCRRSARPFEYAFLLDALQDEQAQGITIDAARCFFQTSRRGYVLIDAPGHIEFLKNMITGASRAQAALLVIDAREGVKENTKRHGYMLSMLGLRQMAVLVNKMDLVGYDRRVFERIREEYAAFLGRLGIVPANFIPVSGLAGVNISLRGEETPWYTGPTVLEQIESFQRREFPQTLPFRLPIQGIYRFTEGGDDRRILAGTIETGTISASDPVTFYPSGKKSRIKSIEYFNGPPKNSAEAGEAPGFTLETQVYVKPGEWMARDSQPPPRVATRFRVNLFWMGRSPMIREKVYKLKLGGHRGPVRLVEVISVLDASELNTVANKGQVDRHDVAEVVLETPKPVAFDRAGELAPTARLVIVDDYEIAGAGIILAEVTTTDSTLREHIRKREISWKPSAIPAGKRTSAYGHGGKFVVFAGEEEAAGAAYARALEKKLFGMNFKAYYLGMENLARGLDADLRPEGEIRDDHLRRLGELARILTDSGQIFITSLAGVDDYDLETLRLLNSPQEILVAEVGPSGLETFRPDLSFTAGTDPEEAVSAVADLLRRKKVIPDYQI